MHRGALGPGVGPKQGCECHAPQLLGTPMCRRSSPHLLGAQSSCSSARLFRTVVLGPHFVSNAHSVDSTASASMTPLVTRGPQPACADSSMTGHFSVPQFPPCNVTILQIPARDRPRPPGGLANGRVTQDLVPPLSPRALVPEACRAGRPGLAGQTTEPVQEGVAMHCCAEAEGRGGRAGGSGGTSGLLSVAETWGR